MSGGPDSKIDEMIEGHEARNKALRRVFIEKGLDLREPRLIECHFWTWSSQDADDIAKSLVALGFKILRQQQAASPRDPSLWNVEAGITQSIELTLRREFKDELVRLAAAYSGEYDGWGTAL